MKKPLPDRNALNADFYAELLYILGLKEIKEGNNKVIARLDDGRTNMASLMDMTEKIVRDKLPLREDDYYDRYGKSPKERVYEISLETSCAK